MTGEAIVEPGSLPGEVKTLIQFLCSASSQVPGVRLFISFLNALISSLSL